MNIVNKLKKRLTPPFTVFHYDKVLLDECLDVLEKIELVIDNGKLRSPDRDALSDPWAMREKIMEVLYYESAPSDSGHS